MIQNCSEQILEDVVRVDLVKASLCDLPIPFNIKAQEMAGTKVVDEQTVDRIGAASLSLAYSVQDGDDGELAFQPCQARLLGQEGNEALGRHEAMVCRPPVPKARRGRRDEAVLVLYGCRA